MVLTHIDLKYVPLIYRKIRQKVPNGKGLKFYWGTIVFLYFLNIPICQYLNEDVVFAKI